MTDHDLGPVPAAAPDAPPGQAAAGADVTAIDVTRPSAARVYDYYLGGFHNFPVDRELGDATIAVFPEARAAAQSARGFLTRAVTHLAADLGVRQFLDLGSGIPTMGNVHEITQAVDPAARVVYVDIEPVAVAHGQQVLAGNPNATSVMADLRDPERVLGHPAVRELLAGDGPTALLLSVVLHFVPDADRPADLLRRYRDALGPGSWIVVSHSTDDLRGDETNAGVNAYRRSGTAVQVRSHAEVLALLDGYDLLPPGLVLAEQWQPGRLRDARDAQQYPIWAAVGRCRTG